MRRDQLPEHKRPTFVMPQYKAVYVAVSKAACTSLKWLVADIQGEDPARFMSSTSRMVTRDMCIHHRGGFKRTPMLHELGDRELEAIRPDNGWFVFTVVRHPAARMFSAWQSKLLLREPRRVIKHGSEPWFPRIPRSTEDVIDDFRRFVLAMAAAPEHVVMTDRHFMPQWREAAPERMPYDRVYDTAEIPVLLEDLGTHLRANGYRGDLVLKESNDTPLRPLAAAFPQDVQDALAALYADDFEHLGYDSVVPAKLHPGDAYPSQALAEVRRLIERHERIGDLADTALLLKEQLAEARKRGSRTRRASLARRLRQRVAAVLPGR